MITNLTHRWLDPKKNPYGGFSGFSWIYHRSEANLEFHFNASLLDMRIALNRKKATLLILHETGHLVTAWPYLMGNVTPGYARASPPDLEMQAWWFCLTILRLVSGPFARENRARPAPPDHHDVTISALLGELVVASP